MLASVYKYKGFYIGRYEAGSVTTRNGESDETTKMVVKRDAYPYNYVSWGASMSDYEAETSRGQGAVNLSKNIYASSTSVASTLCYGVQWDAMLDFIKDATHNVKNSTTWGNYSDSTYTTTAKSKYSLDNGKTWLEGSYEKTSTGEVLLTTGAVEAFKAKNIYDVAGNVWERTTEAHSSDYRVARGGSYISNGSGYPCSYRFNYYPTYSSYNIGFRCSLYIK